MQADDAGWMDALRLEFRTAPPPGRITQEAFDFDSGHLKRLARLKPGDRAEPSDLVDYANDLRYTTIQRDLLAYLLPFCLHAWRDELRGARRYGAFVEHFYPVLADRQVFDEILTARQSAAVSAFMRDAILAEIDDQRGLAFRGSRARPYRWIQAVTTQGVLLPDIEALWTSWWTLGTIGRAVATVQYLSGLMYPDDANPIFAPWTRDGGGGPPCLWEFEGHLYEHRWLEPNVAFLQRTLTPPAVGDVLERAARTLEGEPEHEMAARVLGETPARIDMLTARCAELPRALATPDAWPEWPA
jgi:hypothetical protein